MEVSPVGERDRGSNNDFYIEIIQNSMRDVSLIENNLCTVLAAMLSRKTVVNTDESLNISDSTRNMFETSVCSARLSTPWWVYLSTFS